MGQTESRPKKGEEVEKFDVGLKKKKGEFELFEEEGIKEFKSPLILSFDETFVFNTKDDVDKGLNKLRNYGKLPVNVIHHLLMFHLPIDLVNLLCTCKLFHEISRTNLFWKNYYHNYFGVVNYLPRRRSCQQPREEDQSSKDEEEEGETLNWKKQFFNRFRRGQLLEHRYLRKYEITNKMDSNSRLRDQEVRYALIGKDGIGKRTYLHRFCFDEFDEEKKSERMQAVRFSVSERKILNEMDLSYEENNDSKEINIDGLMLDGKSNNNNNNVIDERFIIQDLIIDVEKDGLMMRINICQTKDINTNYFGFILAFDICDASSFQALEKIVKIIKEKGLKMINTTQSDPTRRMNIVLVALKCDRLRSQRKIEKKRIVDFVRKHQLKGFIEVSSKNGCNINLPILSLFEKAKDHWEFEMDMLEPDYVEYD